MAAGSGGGGDTGSLGNTPNTEGDGSANSSTSNGPTGKTNDAAGNGEWDRSILYGHIANIYSTCLDQQCHCCWLRRHHGVRFVRYQSPGLSTRLRLVIQQLYSTTTSSLEVVTCHLTDL